MSDNKNVRIDLANGISIKIPRFPISKITVPSVPVGECYKRVVLNIDGNKKRNGLI